MKQQGRKGEREQGRKGEREQGRKGDSPFPPFPPSPFLPCGNLNRHALYSRAGKVDSQILGMQ